MGISQTNMSLMHNTYRQKLRVTTSLPQLPSQIMTYAPPPYPPTKLNRCNLPPYFKESLLIKLLLDLASLKYDFA